MKMNFFCVFCGFCGSKLDVTAAALLSVAARVMRYTRGSPIRPAVLHTEAAIQYGGIYETAAAPTPTHQKSKGPALLRAPYVQRFSAFKL